MAPSQGPFYFGSSKERGAVCAVWIFLMEDVFSLMLAMVVAAAGLVGGQLYLDGKQLQVSSPPQYAIVNSTTVNAN